MKLFWSSGLLILLALQLKAKSILIAPKEYYKPYSLFIKGHLGWVSGLNKNKNAGVVNDILYDSEYAEAQLEFLSFTFSLPKNYSLEYSMQLKSVGGLNYQTYLNDRFKNHEFSYSSNNHVSRDNIQYALGLGKAIQWKKQYFKGILMASYNSIFLVPLTVEIREKNTNQYYSFQLNNDINSRLYPWDAWGLSAQIEHHFLTTKYLSLYYNLQYGGHYTNNNSMPLFIRNETTYAVEKNQLVYDKWQQTIGLNFGMDIKLVNFVK